jgi:cytochrome c oxidase subunit II
LHLIVWYLSILFMLLFALAFVFVFMRSKGKADYEPIQKKGYRIRTFYFIALAVILVAAMGLTLRNLPYDKPVQAGAEPTVVHVEAVQFGWVMDKTIFEVGETVEFLVTSKDVNHGFGLYDENMKVLGQTQAMPGYTNKMYYTFKKPGKYQILCLEYCGVAHHFMMSEVEVVTK